MIAKRGGRLPELRSSGPWEFGGSWGGGSVGAGVEALGAVAGEGVFFETLGTGRAQVFVDLLLDRLGHVEVGGGFQLQQVVLDLVERILVRVSCGLVLGRIVATDFHGDRKPQAFDGTTTQITREVHHRNCPELREGGGGKEAAVAGTALEMTGFP